MRQAFSTEDWRSALDFTPAPQPSPAHPAVAEGEWALTLAAAAPPVKVKALSPHCLKELARASSGTSTGSRRCLAVGAAASIKAAAARMPTTAAA